MQELFTKKEMLQLLLTKPKNIYSVCDLSQLTGLSEPTVHKYLSELKSDGFVFYSIKGADNVTRFGTPLFKIYQHEGCTNAQLD